MTRQQLTRSQAEVGLLFLLRLESKEDTIREQATKGEWPLIKIITMTTNHYEHASSRITNIILIDDYNNYSNYIHTPWKQR